MTDALWRRTNFWQRYATLGGAAMIASPVRYRLTSAASWLDDSYRRARSFSSAFMMT
ncbi:MAG: hypothetical protein AAGK04_11010 [Planctomycetota bacterium]